MVHIWSRAKLHSQSGMCLTKGQECMSLEKCKNGLRCKIVALWLKNKIDLYLTESQGGCARLRARVHKQNKGLLRKGVWAAQIELQ